MTRPELLFFCVCGYFFSFTISLSIRWNKSWCNVRILIFLPHRVAFPSVCWERARVFRRWRKKGVCSIHNQGPIVRCNSLRREEKAHGLLTRVPRYGHLSYYDCMCALRPHIGASYRNYYTTRWARAGETECGLVIYWQRSSTGNNRSKSNGFSNVCGILKCARGAFPGADIVILERAIPHTLPNHTQCGFDCKRCKLIPPT